MDLVQAGGVVLEDLAPKAFVDLAHGVADMLTRPRAQSARGRKIGFEQHVVLADDVEQAADGDR